jgi:hydrocephalus-inducing protein
MLSTEERFDMTRHMRVPTIIELLDLSENSHQKKSKVDIEQTLFQPYPSELIFQNYIPFNKTELPLVLRNQDRVPRCIKVTNDNSPYFEIISPGDANKKVAPGMTVAYAGIVIKSENIIIKN